MRRTLFAALAAVCASNFVCQQTHAQVAVTCPTCSDLSTQLLEEAKVAQSYLTGIAELQTSLNQYSNMVTNTIALPLQIFAGVESDIMQVRNLANMASVLTGNSGTILSRLQSAQGYTNTAMLLPQNISNQFTMWQQTLGNASNSLGSTLGVQQSQLSSYTALQKAIQVHSQTAAGQMQAIQAGVEMAALTSTLLQQVQTTLVTTAQQAATRDMIAADRQRMQDLQFQTFMAAPPLATAGWPSY
jgi:P-type conjugative transfer protein TrbJ